jgi:hypothetical protein
MIPFSADRFAETTGLSARDARGLLGHARSRGWLIELPGTDPRQYRGLLAKR